MIAGWVRKAGVKCVPLQLLGDIVARLLHNLLHDADVSFGFITKNGGLADNGSTGAAGGVDELLSEVIQGWDTASQVVETTSDGAVSAALLVQEINKTLLAATTLVDSRVLLVVPALSEELDSGVGRDTVHLSDGLVVGRVGINVGDDTVLLGLEVARDLLVGGFQRLAVSTPRGGESDENILGGI